MAQLPELAGTGPVSPTLWAAPCVGTIAREGTASLSSGRGRGGLARRDPRPGVLLDRDGTIIVDHGYVGSVDRVELIDGAAEAIARLNRARVPVAVVTNQAGVARGFYDISDIEEVHCYVAGLLAEHDAHIDQFFYCPYHPEGTVPEFAHASFNRKPMPGMALAAAAALNLDLTSSWVVGDRPEDIGLAEAVGASAIHVGPETCDRPGVWSFPDSLRGHTLYPRTDGVVTTTYGPAARTHTTPFPAVAYDSAASYSRAYFEELAKAAAAMDPLSFDRATEVLLDAYTKGGSVFSCGNGGSASVANHLQCDHVKGVRTGTDLEPARHQS